VRYQAALHSGRGEAFIFKPFSKQAKNPDILKFGTNRVEMRTMEQRVPRKSHGTFINRSEVIMPPMRQAEIIWMIVFVLLPIALVVGLAHKFGWI
jgi:hypothetical protein